MGFVFFVELPELVLVMPDNLLALRCVLVGIFSVDDDDEVPGAGVSELEGSSIYPYRGSEISF